MAVGSEQAKSIDPKNPQAGSTKLVSDLKTKVGKQDNQPVQAAVSNEDARRELLNIKSIVSVLT